MSREIQFTLQTRCISLVIHIAPFWWMPKLNSILKLRIDGAMHAVSFKATTRVSRLAYLSSSVANLLNQGLELEVGPVFIRTYLVISLSDRSKLSPLVAVSHFRIEEQGLFWRRVIPTCWRSVVQVVLS